MKGKSMIRYGRTREEQWRRVGRWLGFDEERGLLPENVNNEIEVVRQRLKSQGKFDLFPDARQQIIDRFKAGLQKAEYPVRSPAAANELKQRGYDVTASRLQYLVKTGEIPSPGVVAKTLMWSAEDIDRAAEYLDENREFTPEAFAAYSMGFRLADMDAAVDAVKLCRSDEDYLSITISGPCRPEEGITRRVTARRLNAQEISLIEV
jgi:hypothetical protein